MRLGKFEATKTRPLKVTMLNKTDVRKVHLSTYKLGDEEDGPYSDISVAYDLSPAEREELNNLIKEAKEKTTQDPSGKWEFKVRSQGPRWNPKITKLRKRHSKNQAASVTRSAKIREILTLVPGNKTGSSASNGNITDCGKLKPIGSFHGPNSK